MTACAAESFLRCSRWPYNVHVSSDAQAMVNDGQVELYRAQAHAMVEDQIRRRGIRDERLLAAMEHVPRHEFIPEYSRPIAYEDMPVGIGEQQTISQPYIVAAMLEALTLTPEDRVLEIGTGSGYQTALLAELVSAVYSIERFESLAEAAFATLRKLGYANVRVRVGDGTHGWPEQAPFDAIIVSAAAPRIPEPLFEQLREGGRMIVPVGSAEGQDLALVRKLNGRPDISYREGCRFVPLVGEHGFRSGW